MNISEKKRAEEMVREWTGRRLDEIKSRPVPEIEKPHAADQKAFDEAIKVLRELKKTYSFGDYQLDNGVSGRHVLERRAAKSEALAKHHESVKNENTAVIKKADALIAEIWDNKHTFDSVQKALG